MIYNKQSSLMHPRVSIGMPVYNGEKYIEEALKSNLHQTYEDFILYIADNASTDRTQEICQDYSSMDNRIIYIRNPQNLGAAKNYSICFAPAQSEYFRWANADDTAESTLIEKCITFLDDNPDYILTYAKTNIIDNDGNFLEKYNDNLDLQQDTALDRFKYFHHNVGLNNIFYGLMRRELLAKSSLLGNYIASDINLIGELSLYGKFNEIPEYLFNRRMHADASSWDRSDDEKQKEFWDPSKAKMGLNTYRRLYEYYKAVLRSPVDIKEKTKLLLFLTRTIYWKKEKLYKELNNHVRYSQQTK